MSSITAFIKPANKMFLITEIQFNAKGKSMKAPNHIQDQRSCYKVENQGQKTCGNWKPVLSLSPNLISKFPTRINSIFYLTVPSEL